MSLEALIYNSYLLSPNGYALRREANELKKIRDSCLEPSHRVFFYRFLVLLNSFCQQGFSLTMKQGKKTIFS